MSTAILITRLLQIERALGKSHALEIRTIVMEAQGCALELEQQMIEVLQENQRLRERMERCEHSSFPAPAAEQAPAAVEHALTFSKIAEELSRMLGRKPSGSEKHGLGEAAANSVDFG
jgi:hypothetical protein